MTLKVTHVEHNCDVDQGMKELAKRVRESGVRSARGTWTCDGCGAEWFVESDGASSEAGRRRQRRWFR